MLDLDPEVPPEAEEGETGGGADVVRPIVVVSLVVAPAAIVSKPAAASTARPWTTAIVPR